MTTTMTAPAGRQRIYLTSGVYDTSAAGTIAVPDTEIAACMACGYTLVTAASVSGVTYKGAIACAGNPNYPAASVGDQYKVSTAGKIGGSSGLIVEVGDTIECTVATVAGDHATVGASWMVGQTNVQKAVEGPASTVTTNSVVCFDGTTGALLKEATAPVVVGTATTAGLLAITPTVPATAPGSVRGIVAAMVTSAGAYASGTLAAIRGIVTYATQTLTNVFTYGVQGKMVGAGSTIVAGSSHVCGVLAQMDLAGTTVTSGHIAPLIVSGQMLPASAYVNMAYFESGGNKINAAEQFNVAANFLWDINNFESCGILATPSGATHSGNLRTIKVQIDGATYYILAAAVISA